MKLSSIRTLWHFPNSFSSKMATENKNDTKLDNVLKILVEMYY